MTHHRKHILSPVLAVFALSTAIAASLIYGTRAAAPQPPAKNGSRGGDMFELLEKSAKRTRAAEKVKKAQLSPNVEEVNRDYENSVHELADVLFNEFGAELPAAITEKMKERLIRAELKYREDGRGVRESNVVEAVNSLADKFGAPNYAKTTELQVRTMRASLRANSDWVYGSVPPAVAGGCGDGSETRPLPRAVLTRCHPYTDSQTGLRRYLPNLVAVETQPDRMGLRQPVGTGMNPEVSPLEAAFLTLLAVQQKMLNDDWQQTPDEWAANQKKYLARVAAAGQPQADEASQFGVLSGDEEKRRRNDQKRNQMRRMVLRGAAKLNAARLNDLAQSSLDTLGIAKVEEVR